ncbi:MAG: lamin tail domain-containing protein, partial [Flavobacteriales bacterium]
MLALFSAVLAFPLFSQDLIITELTDPDNSSTAGRYVEIYNSSDSDIDLSAGYALQRWTNASTTPQSPRPLTGIIAAEGFYVVCNDAALFLATYGADASQDVGTGGVADSNGDDHIALLDPNGNILDIYGTPGQDGNASGGTSEFEDGRAERKCGTSAAAIFVPADWNMDHDSGGGDGELDAPGGFDPFSWTDDAGDPCVQDICPGADVEIATSSFEYLPAAIDVEAGTVVGWVNYGGNHNVNGITNSI